MDEATWKAIEGYRQTGHLVPCWRDGKVVYLTVDEALASRSDYQQRTGKPPPSEHLAESRGEQASACPDEQTLVPPSGRGRPPPD